MPIKRDGKTADGKAWFSNSFGDETEVNYLQEVLSSDDRVRVIVGVARLEGLLRELLGSYLADGNGTRSRVLDPTKDGAISTFAAMVDMTLILGLLTAEDTKGLKGLAKLRNVFAHDYRIRSFKDLTSQEAKSLVKKTLKDFVKAAKPFVIFNSDEQEIAAVNNPELLRILFLHLWNSLETELQAARIHLIENEYRCQIRTGEHSLHNKPDLSGL